MTNEVMLTKRHLKAGFEVEASEDFVYLYRYGDKVAVFPRGVSAKAICDEADRLLAEG
ncbi:hypothetical protein M1N59_02115 [Dehalococcoidales bacterium]|nr:hypothetical protein [Dehalococcoidales bacterium]